MRVYNGPKVRGVSLRNNTNSKKKERRAARATRRLNSRLNIAPSTRSIHPRLSLRNRPPSRSTTRSIQPTINPLLSSGRRIELG